jgi:hypothetical protein
MLEVLDQVLARLRDGVAVGAERSLADIVRNPTPDALGRWLRYHPVRSPALSGPTVEVLLVGTGGSRAGGTTDNVK